MLGAPANYSLNALLAVKVNITLNHLNGFQKCNRFATVNTLCFQDRDEFFIHCVIIRIATF